MEDIVGALDGAFNGGEFSALELVVDPAFGRVLGSHESIQVDEHAARLRIVYDRVLHPDQEYEIRVPIILPGERTGTVLSVP